MGQFKLRGFKAESGDLSESQRARTEGDGIPEKGEQKRVFAAVGRVRGEFQAEHDVEVRDDDVVELVFDDGIRRLIRGEELKELIASQPGAQERGLASEDGFEIPARIHLDPDSASASRGLGGWVLRRLGIYKRVADEAAEVIVKRLTRKLIKGLTGGRPGVYHLRTENDAPRSDEASSGGDEGQAWSPCGEEATPRSLERAGAPAEPILVLVHGTFSSTTQGFSDLWTSSGGRFFEKLSREFGERMIAIEHDTLGTSPIDNAIMLVEALPKGARLHVLSHSRGGLVGELLCRGQRVDGRAPFTEEELDRFELRAKQAAKERDMGEREQGVQARAATLQRKRLEELGKLLRQKEIRIERFVRVACPAVGTTLASGRLDRWLNVAFEVLEHVPGISANPFFDVARGLLEDLVLAVVRKRLSLEDLPGLEAMDPDSGLVWLLNTSSVETEADLHVVAGDVQGSGILGRLMVFASDLFFGEDHDLVVNTPAMFGGAPREDDLRYLFASAVGVNHMTYFSDEERRDVIAAPLVNALLGRKEPRFQALDHGGGRAEEESYRSEEEELAAARPVVFVLPDLFGSQLCRGDDPVWLDPGQIVEHGLKELLAARSKGKRKGASSLRPHGLVPSLYGPLLERLSRTHKPVAVAYDWRASLKKAADDFAATLQTAGAAGEGQEPLWVLGHGAGALVALSALRSRPALWSRLIEKRDVRLLLIDAPIGGSLLGLQLAFGAASPDQTAEDAGEHPLIRALARLDPTADRQLLSNGFARMQSLLDLLPFEREPGGLDLGSASSWRLLRDATRRGPDTAALPGKAALDAARAFREALSLAPMEQVDRIHLLQSQQVWTPRSVSVGGGALRWDGRDGDGVNLWASLGDRFSNTFFVNCGRGEILQPGGALGAICDLLARGSSPLFDSAPTKSDHAARPAKSRRDSGFPSAAVLSRILSGATHGVLEQQKKRALRAWVTHGDLFYAHAPVIVGHYEGSGIYSAERALDKILGGVLDYNLQLGVYPGALSTEEVYCKGGDLTTPCALVFGLGPFGDLKPAVLQKGLERVLLRYAERKQRALRTRGGGNGGDSNAVTALLVGSGQGGVPVEESVRAILSAVLSVNETLARHDGHGLEVPLLFDELEIIELFQDVAITAAHALHDLAESTGFEGMVRVAKDLRTVQGRRERVSSRQRDDWWRRMSIAREAGGHGLVFKPITDTARVQVLSTATQARIVEDRIQNLIRSPESDEGEGKLLFNLLIPLDLQVHLSHKQSLILQLDDHTAGYPWELLQDRDSMDRPLAVEAGLLRQFESVNYRSPIRRSTGRNALIVGEPMLGKDSGFPALPGAVQEAKLVKSQLQKRNYDVSSTLINADANAIIRALFDRPYQIMHLAGHGVVGHDPLAEGDSRCEECPTRIEEEQERTRYTGMVLGDGIFLSAAELLLLPWVPDVVFLNCCHLGKTEEDSGVDPEAHLELKNVFAASVARTFIEMGVRAVIVAGWAVSDRAAELFASTFYDRFLRGDSFGDSVREAREKTWTVYREVNTWGAYHCYGDPGYRLVTGGSRGRSEYEPPRFVCSSELVAEVRGLTGRSEVRSGAKAIAIRRKLDTLSEIAAGRFADDATVLESLADAYREAGDFQKATENYLAAARCETAAHSVQSLERYVNIIARLQTQSVCAAIAKGDEALRAAGKEALEQFTLCTQLLDDLQRFGKTGRVPDDRVATLERSALIGSIHKREAMVRMLIPVSAALEERQKLARTVGELIFKAEKAYTGRSSMHRRADADRRSYAFGNAQTAMILRGVTDALTGAKRPAKDWSITSEKLRHSRAVRVSLHVPVEDRKRDFWAELALADRELTNFLEDALWPLFVEDLDGADAKPQDFQARLEILSTLFAAALGKQPSERQRSTLLDHLHLIELLATLLADIAEAQPAGRDGAYDEPGALRGVQSVVGELRASISAEQSTE